MPLWEMVLGLAVIVASLVAGVWGKAYFQARRGGSPRRDDGIETTKRDDDEHLAD